MNLRQRNKSRQQPNKAKAAVANPQPHELKGCWVVLTLWVVLVAYFVWWRGVWLPDPKTSANTPASEFSEERARRHLEVITEDIGVRVVGSYNNEILTPQYLLSQFEKIEAELNNLEFPALEMEVDIQRVSSSFFIPFIIPFTNAYTNVTNILVRLSPKGDDKVKENSLLISAHYDSAILSPGATDDGINIANMMEILRNLVHTNKKFQHSIIFNFNGAEEAILEAAHGFITQHEWGKTIRAFINLEAAGAGGQETLFQAGPKNAWLAESYARSAPYPNGNAIAQDVFQSGVIPSDTDFRIYRDFGNLSGLDFAYVTNGYVYHTPLDNLGQIHQGSLQRCGENMLAVTRDLLDSPFLDPAFDSPIRNESAVYFDFFGAFMIYYPESVAFYINWTVFLVIIALFRKQLCCLANIKEFFIMLQTWVLALATAMIVANLFLVLGKPMRWFSSPLLAVLIYGFPAAFGISLVHVYRSKEISTAKEMFRNEERAYFAAITFWLLLLGISIAFSLGTAVEANMYLVSVTCGRLMWYSLRTIPKEKDGSQSSLNLSIDQQILYLLCYLLSATVPLMFFCVNVNQAIDFFVPMMGRIGDTEPADIIIGAVIPLLLCIASTLMCHLLHWFHSIRRNILKVSFAGTLLIFIYAVQHPSYTRAAPKRLFLQHTFRHFRGKHGQENVSKDSGIWLLPLDSTSVDPLLDLGIRQFENATFQECNGIYCSMPWFMPYKTFVINNWYLEAPAPVLVHPTTLELTSEEVTETIRHLEFRASGPDHMTLFINDTVINWSFTEEVPPAFDESHFVFFASGGNHDSPESWTGKVSWEFWIEVAKDHPVELSFASHDFSMTPSEPIQQILDQMPEWIQPVWWLSYWESWEF